VFKEDDLIYMRADFEQLSGFFSRTMLLIGVYLMLSLSFSLLLMLIVEKLI
jgi:hypothetical protein